MRRQPKVKQPVPMDEAKRRAVAYLKKHRRELCRASELAGAIWPGVEFRGQGAGGAASRILKALEADGLAYWTTDHHGTDHVSWGWVLTAKGRK